MTPVCIGPIFKPFKSDNSGLLLSAGLTLRASLQPVPAATTRVAPVNGAGFTSLKMVSFVINTEISRAENVNDKNHT